MKTIGRFILLLLAFIFLGMGVVGIVLPVLPTTPFFLLAAALFARSSKRFHNWFITTKLYQKYIHQAINKKSMTKEAKCKMMITLGIIFTAGIIFTPVWYGKTLILLIAVGHFFFFLKKIKTVSEIEEETKVL